MTKKLGFARVRRSPGRISYKDTFSEDKGNTNTTIPKQKKIYKVGRSKDTILTQIQLEIIDLFSRSFTNGQIGVKFPQQKKKGMMRLLNHCFKVIIEEVEFTIGPKFKALSNSEENRDKKEKSIFHMSSNYRYKHIDKSLLQAFKKICNVYVKYHCFDTMPVNQLQSFYKKLVLGGSSANKIEKKIKQINLGAENQNDVAQNQESGQEAQSASEVNIEESQRSQIFQEEQHHSQENQSNEEKSEKSQQQQEQSEKVQIKPISLRSKKAQQIKKHQSEPSTLQNHDNQNENQTPSKICIQKVNIYFGYARDQTTIKKKAQEAQKRFNSYLKPKPIDSEYFKENTKKWNMDMESYLIEQFMNQSAVEPNLIIRNMMKRFGRNKLFVERVIVQKKKEMFKQCVNKFIAAFNGKTLCTPQKVKQMEKSLKSNSLSPKNYFIARFIHDFYFKDVQAISVTLLSQYMFKLSNNSSLYGQSKRVQKLKEQIDICFDYQDRKEKDRQLAREKLKAAVTNFLGQYQLQA